MYWSVSGFQKRKPPEDDLRIETYVGVYIYKSYNKCGVNSASVGLKLFNYVHSLLCDSTLNPFRVYTCKMLARLNLPTGVLCDNARVTFNWSWKLKVEGSLELRQWA
jgi:hypothetical protein